MGVLLSCSGVVRVGLEALGPQGSGGGSNIGQRVESTAVTTRSPKPRTSSIKPPNPQKDPQRSAELPPMPTPTSANSDTSPANSDGPLANFGACPAATDTYPGLPKPREPPPLFLIFAHPS
ncbi:hypothetical protein E4T56_gene941, partial [Termitomyces sp. T112]